MENRGVVIPKADMEAYRALLDIVETTKVKSDKK